MLNLKPVGTAPPFGDCFGPFCGTVEPLVQRLSRGRTSLQAQHRTKPLGSAVPPAPLGFEIFGRRPISAIHYALVFYFCGRAGGGSSTLTLRDVQFRDELSFVWFHSLNIFTQIYPCVATCQPWLQIKVCFSVHARKLSAVTLEVKRFSTLKACGSPRLLLRLACHFCRHLLHSRTQAGWWWRVQTTMH